MREGIIDHFRTFHLLYINRTKRERVGRITYGVDRQLLFAGRRRKEEDQKKVKYLRILRRKNKPKRLKIAFLLQHSMGVSYDRSLVCFSSQSSDLYHIRLYNNNVM
jgi:hypothetical protein